MALKTLLIAFALSLSLPFLSDTTPYAVSTTPEPRSVEYSWMSIATWYRHHADDVEASYAEDTQIVFIGDSITESWGWGDAYIAEFNKHFGTYKTVNFGVGGDQTQNVLWRLQNGAKGKLSPKAIVLMIGVNNLGAGGQAPAEVAKGIDAVIAQVRLNFPKAHILLHGILPFGELATNPSRKRVKQTNAIIKNFANQYVHYYDFGELFLDKNDSIPKNLMADFLHPTAQGMSLLGEKLQPIVKNWINETAQEK